MVWLRIEGRARQGTIAEVMTEIESSEVAVSDVWVERVDDRVVVHVEVDDSERVRSTAARHKGWSVRRVARGPEKDRTTGRP